MKLFNIITATLVVLLTSFGGVSAQETQPHSEDASDHPDHTGRIQVAFVEKGSVHC